MKRFDINDAIAHYGLDIDELSRVLFPLAKFPKAALSRVMKHESNLDIVQLENMADYIGVTLTDLLSCDTWKGTSEDGCLTFVKGQYKVKLSYKGAYLSLYKGLDLIYREVANVPAMSVEEFISYVENIINNLTK